MPKFIDRFLDHTTMYRLILYYLIFILVMAFFLSFFGVFSFNAFELLISVLFLIIIGLITNVIFAKTFQAPTNVESVYISALILALIITPIHSIHDFWFLFWAAVWTMASKFIFATNKKHIFNPVAFAVFLTSIAISQSASWWVGTLAMLPAVLLGGILIVRKIKKIDMVLSFLIVSIITVIITSLLKGTDPRMNLKEILLFSPWLFFAFVMLTEPLTTPPTKKLQIIYGAIIGFLFAPQIHLGSFYATPEITLLLGNLFSYLVSPKERLILKLKNKIKLNQSTYDFVFDNQKRINYQPGQYMEWTLPHKESDNRGNRRYFTLASSPTENDLKIGVKFYEAPSSFKKSLWAMDGKEEIAASQLAGDFVLPKNPNQKLVFIAGGIGITPFRSMLKYLLDTGQKRSIIVFYSNKTANEIVYTGVLNEAGKKLGIKTIYNLTDTNNIPNWWQGKIGFINESIIKQEAPDYKERIFYISGPPTMVAAYEKMLATMGVSKKQIKTDFFPGFA